MDSYGSDVSILILDQTSAPSLVERGAVRLNVTVHHHRMEELILRITEEEFAAILGIFAGR